jgi:hypothetical protein
MTAESWDNGDDEEEDEGEENWGDDGRNEDDDATIPCPHCRRSIYEDSERCPYCGNYISDEDLAPAHKPWWIIVGVLLALSVVAWWIIHIC